MSLGKQRSIKSCQTYLGKPGNTGKHGYCTIRHKSESSWKPVSPHCKLAAGNKGSVGPRHSGRVPDKVHFRTSPEPEATPQSVQSSTTGARAERDCQALLKRSSDRAHGYPSGRFCVDSISSPKEGRWSETSGQPQKFKHINFVEVPHFKMEGIHTLKSLVLKKDWLVKIDLKDAYFSIPVHQNHRKFLCFQVKDKLYQFNCLPFGLASAPWVFTKTLKPVAALGRELGMRLVVYIDDILLGWQSRSQESARDQASALIYLLQCLGFTINKEKTISEPCQSLQEFLGFTVNTLTMEVAHVALPLEKLKKIRAESRKLAEAGQVTARALSRLIGKNECSQSSNTASSTVLQTPTDGSSDGSENIRSGLRGLTRPVCRQQRRADLVGS